MSEKHSKSKFINLLYNFVKRKPNITNKELKLINEDKIDVMRIGVCGDPGAGKSVLLTAIFKTISTINGFIFDNKRGATHFRRIEDEIKTTGKTSGTITNEIFLLSLKHTLTESVGNYKKGDELPVYLLDLAGAHCEDRVDFENAGDQDKDRKAKFNEVDRFLDQCDALIILISSTRLFENRNGREELFSDHVKHEINNFLQKRIPIALVFTQKDQNPMMENDRVEKLPSVIQFKDQLDKNGGFVELITCYELDSSDKPKSQNDENSIWRNDARDVFKKVFDAGLPLVKEKIDTRYQEEINKKRKRRNKFLLLFVVLILALSVAGGFWYVNKMNVDVRFVNEMTDNFSQGVPSLNADELQRLSNLVTPCAIENNQSEQIGIKNDDLNRACKNFWIMFKKNVIVKVEKSSGISNINLHERSKTVALALLPSPKPDWWINNYEPIFNARIESLHGLQNFQENISAKKHKKVVNYVEQQKQLSYSLEDTNFSMFLDSFIELYNKEIFKMWSQDIRLQSNLRGRLKVIKDKLQNDIPFMQENDTLIARKFLTGKAISAILTMRDNKFTKEILVGMKANVQSDGIAYSFRAIYIQLQRDGKELDYFTSKYSSLVKGIGKIQNHTAQDSLLIRAVFASALDNITISKQGELFRQVIKIMASNYLFDTHESGWVAGVNPLTDVISNKLNQNHSPRSLINYLTNWSIYTIELTTLDALIKSRLIRYEVIRSYKSILSTGSCPSLATIENLKTRVEMLTIPRESYLKHTRKYYRARIREINSLLKLIKSCNGSDDKKTYEDVSKQVKGWLLKRHCHKTYVGDCANVH